MCPINMIIKGRKSWYILAWNPENKEGAKEQHDQNWDNKEKFRSPEEIVNIEDSQHDASHEENN